MRCVSRIQSHRFLNKLVNRQISSFLVVEFFSIKRRKIDKVKLYWFQYWILLNWFLAHLQILPLTLSNDEEIIADQSFLLNPPTSVEPPKEKPPPPPVDDDENPSPEPLKRLNSTRRIKKELRTRRSDFLGIEGVSAKIKIYYFYLENFNFFIKFLIFLQFFV